MPTDNDRKRLRELAEAATPGPWEHEEDAQSGHRFVTKPTRKHWIRVARTLEAQARNAHFIAAANPAAVLSLLDQLEAVEVERDAARWADETRKKAAQALVLENSRLVDVDIQLACAKQSLAQQDAALAASQQETERLRALLGEAVAKAVDGALGEICRQAGYTLDMGMLKEARGQGLRDGLAVTTRDEQLARIAKEGGVEP